MEAKKDEKIVMVLEMKKEEPVSSLPPVVIPEPEPVMEIAMEEEKWEEEELAEITEQPAMTIQVEEEETLKPSLQPTLVEPEEPIASNEPVIFTMPLTREITVDKQVEKKEEETKIEWVLSLPSEPASKAAEPQLSLNEKSEKQHNSPSSAARGGYLAKPSNIYAEPKSEESFHEHKPPVKEPVLTTSAKPVQEEEPSMDDLQLVFKDDIPAADAPRAHQAPPNVTAISSNEEPALQDEEEEQRRRAQERLQKLRNLSFNVNATDPNNEFETVPAYIRRNLELYNTISSVENFYSNYEVRKDDDTTARLSTINTFLDGKKPD